MSAVLVAVGLLAGSFLLDRAFHHGRVVRNVLLDGVPVGGVALTELDHRLRTDAGAYGQQPLVIDFGDLTIESTADEYGYLLEVEETTSAVARIGREGGLWDQFRAWMGRLRSAVGVHTSFASSPEVARLALVDHSAPLATAPVDPTIGNESGELWIDTGAPGRQVDIGATIESMADAANLTDIEGVWAPVPPSVAPGDAVALFTSLNARVGRGVVLNAQGARVFVEPRMLASWITAAARDGEMVVSFDETDIARAVDEALFGYIEGELTVDYDVVDGVPLVDDVADSRMVCCDPSVVDLIVSALDGSGGNFVDLPLRPATADEQAAAIRDLGVVEEVATFTTSHNCCESRVTNIHRIADLLHDVVLLPGEVLSINERVGERTRENGFVEGGVIYQGEFESDVGGGISQYATTLFNAAFFAGLEFDSYQSHSLYLSRYPYGREATVSFPEPDLVIRNQTPYAVLLWSSYTGRSITVTLYSTRHVTVTQTGQDIDRSSACTRVTTHRLREYNDGTVTEDAVYAFYRPTAGYSCGALEIPESDP